MASKRKQAPPPTAAETDHDQLIAALLDERKLIEERVKQSDARLYQFIALVVTPCFALLGYSFLYFDTKARFILLGMPLLAGVAAMVLGMIYTQQHIGGHYGRYLAGIINGEFRRAPLLLEKLDYVYLVRGFNLQYALMLVCLIFIVGLDCICLLAAPALLADLGSLQVVAKDKLWLVAWGYWVLVVVVYILVIAGFVAQFFVRLRQMRRAIRERNCSFD